MDKDVIKLADCIVKELANSKEAEGLTNFKSGLILIIKALLSTTLKKSESNLMEKE